MSDLTIETLNQLRIKLQLDPHEIEQLNADTTATLEYLMSLLQIQFSQFAYNESIEEQMKELLTLLQENEMFYDAEVIVD